MLQASAFTDAEISAAMARELETVQERPDGRLSFPVDAQSNTF